MLGNKEVLCILFLINLSTYGNAKDYCSSEICSASKEHTLCKFQVKKSVLIIFFQIILLIPKTK